MYCVCWRRPWKQLSSGQKVTMVVIAPQMGFLRLLSVEWCDPSRCVVLEPENGYWGVTVGFMFVKFCPESLRRSRKNLIFVPEHNFKSLPNQFKYNLDVYSQWKLLWKGFENNERLWKDWNINCQQPIVFSWRALRPAPQTNGFVRSNGCRSPNSSYLSNFSILFDVDAMTIPCYLPKTV